MGVAWARVLTVGWEVDRAVRFGHINVELANVPDVGGGAEGSRVTPKLLAHLGVAPWSGEVMGGVPAAADRFEMTVSDALQESWRLW